MFNKLNFQTNIIIFYLYSISFSRILIECKNWNLPFTTVSIIISTHHGISSAIAPFYNGTRAFVFFSAERVRTQTDAWESKVEPNTDSVQSITEIHSISKQLLVPALLRRYVQQDTKHGESMQLPALLPLETQYRALKQ